MAVKTSRTCQAIRKRLGMLNVAHSEPNEEGSKALASACALGMAHEHRRWMERRGCRAWSLLGSLGRAEGPWLDELTAAQALQGWPPSFPTSCEGRWGAG